MRLYRKKEECCGCGACEAICGTHAITMHQDKEGFFYPKIDERQCVGCGRCNAVCPFKQSQKAADFLQYYGARNINEKVRRRSSSGGIFSVLANYVLERSGSVFAAGFKSDMNVCHMEIQEKMDLDQVRRTKYVQSDMKNVFGMIRRRLDKEKWVLFVGTPCQAEALRGYLGKNFTNLIITDLVCYGAASPGIWQKYVDFLNQRYKGKILEYNFRDKRNQDNGHMASWKNCAVEKAYPLSKDPYSRMYFANMNLRPACYRCPFCKVERNSDFTIGDFWGIEKVRPDWDDGMGNSLVILHSIKAERVWEEVQDQCEVFQCRKEEILQPRLIEPTEYPRYRKVFMKVYQYAPFSLLVRKYSR